MLWLLTVPPGRAYRRTISHRSSVVKPAALPVNVDLTAGSRPAMLLLPDEQAPHLRAPAFGSGRRLGAGGGFHHSRHAASAWMPLPCLQGCSRGRSRASHSAERVRVPLLAPPALATQPRECAADDRKGHSARDGHNHIGWEACHFHRARSIAIERERPRAAVGGSPQ